MPGAHAQPASFAWFWWFCGNRFLFLGLRKRVSAYLVMLEQQARRKPTTAPSAAVVATVTAVTVVQESKRATMDKKLEQPVQLPESAAASLSTSPLLVPAAPSDGLVELSDQDGAAKHIVLSSLQLPSSPSAHKNSSPTVGSSSGGNAALLRLDPSTGGSSFSFSTAAPSARVDASSSPARVVRPTLAQVAPAPLRAAGVPFSSAVVRTGAGSTAGAVPLGGVPQSDARLDELRGAIRKLNIMTVFMSIPLVGTSCVAIPNLLRYANGEILDEIVRSPTADSDGFPWLSGAATSFTLVTLLVALYDPTHTFAPTTRHHGVGPVATKSSVHAHDVTLTFLFLCS